MAGFNLECMAGFFGIRDVNMQQFHRLLS